MKSKIGGFTLVEVTIAIATLAILSTIAIYGLFGAREDAQSKKRSATVGLIEQAKTRYIISTSPDAIGMETEITDIMSYMQNEGVPIDSIFKLVEGTGKKYRRVRLRQLWAKTR